MELLAGSSEPVLLIGGRAAATPLRDTDRVTADVVDYFERYVAPCYGLPVEQLREDLVQLIHSCLVLVTDMLDHGAVPATSELGAIRAAATRWAGDGVPLTAIVRACHEGARIAFGMVTAPAKKDDVEQLRVAGELMLELMNAIIAGASEAYVTEQLLVTERYQSATEGVASALLGYRGHPVSARRVGVAIADSYEVVALTIPEHPDERDAELDSDMAARRKLRRLRSEIAAVFGPRALALLGPEGGTLLIALGAAAEATVCVETLALLSEAAQVPLTATVVISDTDQIPESADQVHELLTLVRSGRRPPGLYRMRDLDIEYQLTRSRLATRRIAAVLDPLHQHPELLETVRSYLASDMNRQRTASRLYIHPNTVDHRLRRVARLTGIELTTSAGIWRASVALLAYDHLDKATPGADDQAAN
ncbi:PucR family transcriptional regulator [Nocardia callitridis]